MSLLSALNRAGALRTLDHALATSLRRLDPSTPDPVLAAAALASLAVAQGHAGFDPARPQWLVDADLDWPVPQAWPSWPPGCWRARRKAWEDSTAILWGQPLCFRNWALSWPQPAWHKSGP